MWRLNLVFGQEFFYIGLHGGKAKLQLSSLLNIQVFPNLFRIWDTML